MHISHKQIDELDVETVKLLNIVQSNKKHLHCDLLIKNSKNNVHRGLYCCNHKKWLQWLAYEQEGTLIKMGVQAKSRIYVDMDWQ
jgi:hypothetical protein